jgi:hypothetical protein
MVHLETDQPHWVSFFVLTLFLGVRPDGEMGRLANAIEAEGIQAYFQGNMLRISARIAKDGRERLVPILENVRLWLERYPISPKSIRPGDSYQYAAIREKFQIPRDGLRHTSETACAVVYGILAATKRHGNSPRVADEHYLSEMSAEDANAFYSILPMELSGDKTAMNEPLSA